MKKKTVSIKNIIPDFDYNVFIIAEIGINHEGSLNRCKELIDKAKDAGADAIKLQTIDADLNYCKGSESYKIFKKTELSRSQTIQIFKYCKKKKIRIFSTVGDKQTLKWIANEKPFAYKISSGLLNNTPLIEEIFKLKEPVFISTGMANKEDLVNLCSLIQKYKKKNISMLHCVSMYPTQTHQLDLNTMTFLKKKFKCPVGYSDHSIDENIPVFAMIAGAQVIEKHFTFDNKRAGYDHKLSFNNIQFSRMVKKIRKYECSLKSNDINKIKSEKRLIFARCIVAKKSIKKDEKLTHDNLIIKRPNSSYERGAEPIYFDFIKGKKIKKATTKDSPINLKDVY